MSWTITVHLGGFYFFKISGYFCGLFAAVYLLIHASKAASSSLVYCSAPDATELVMKPLASEINSAQYVRTNAGRRVVEAP
jgi:hypothetical protein